MNYMGSVIKEYRSMIGMSRQSLSEDICSEKYVYLIEKGERTPSSNMVRLFSDKLGVDLFKYYEYLHCISPIDVEATIHIFDRYRRKTNMDGLKDATDKAMELSDFHKKPWLYEIQVNQLSYMILKEGKSKEAIKKIRGILQEAEPKDYNSISFANLYVLLSTSYQMARDMKSAKNAVMAAYQIIKDKKNDGKYIQTIITVRINKITMHYLSGEYDEVIKEGLELAQYQLDMNEYERFHHVHFYLAFAHYIKGLEEEGVSWFVKGLHICLAIFKPIDVYYLSSYEMFDVLAKDPRVSKDLINEFSRKYHSS